MAYNAPHLGQCDEIGRHEGFKIPCPSGRGGSSPPTGTNPFLVIKSRSDLTSFPKLKQIFSLYSPNTAAR